MTSPPDLIPAEGTFVQLLRISVHIINRQDLMTGNVEMSAGAGGLGAGTLKMQTRFSRCQGAIGFGEAIP
jgi:hypothetical protein